MAHHKNIFIDNCIKTYRNGMTEKSWCRFHKPSLESNRVKHGL